MIAILGYLVRLQLCLTTESITFWFSDWTPNLCTPQFSESYRHVMNSHKNIVNNTPKLIIIIFRYTHFNEKTNKRQKYFLRCLYSRSIYLFSYFISILYTIFWNMINEIYKEYSEL